MSINGYFKKGLVIKEGSPVAALLPSDAYTSRIISELPQDALVRVRATRPRNRKHHNLWHVLCQTLADNSSYTKRQIEQLLKRAAGAYEEVRLKDGSVAVIYESTSWDSMDQDEFGDFYNRVSDFIASDIIPSINADTLRREIEKMAGLDNHRE